MRRWAEGPGPGPRFMRLIVLAAVLAATNACAPTAPKTSGPSPSLMIAQPSASPVIGIDWARAASVERPANFEVDPSAPAYQGTHPILRIPGQAIMSDVIGLSEGGFAAVGYIPPDWIPAAWSSPDGSTWSIHSLGATGFTFPVAMATGVDGPIVAVGRSGPKPVAWTSADGVAWQRHQVPVLGVDGVAERMTTVVAAERGYVAGGSVGPELFERHARFWKSVDGIDWRPVPDDPAAFANAEVRAITRFGDGFVAVGVVGTAQEPSAAVAWTSADGVTWTRSDDPSFVDGVAVAVVPAPFGGLVAVGSDLDRREAVAWTSPDGRRWTWAPTEASRKHSGGFVWMSDVVAIDDTLIAIGAYQGLQRATATSWVSHDGSVWEQARSAPVQEQGEFFAVTPGGPGVIVVGTFGGPDSYVPTVWLSPGR
jgi:hypothetical protein